MSAEECFPFVRPGENTKKVRNTDFVESQESLSVKKSCILSSPSSAGGEGSFSASLSELWPLDLRWCEEGDGGVGEAFGVGGKVVMLVTPGELGLAGVLSNPFVLSSDVLPFSCGCDFVFFAIRAPFLAFLNRTDVRRPTPTRGKVGGVPSGVTS